MIGMLAPKEVEQHEKRFDCEHKGQAREKPGAFLSGPSVGYSVGLAGLAAISLFAVLGFSGSCQPNAAPFSLTVTGDSILNAGREYTFSVRCADVERDSISARFLWGDGDTSDWSHYIRSGDTISKSHTWSQTGYLHVEAQSKDWHGAAADWRSRKEVRVLDTTVVKWIAPVGGFSWSVPACPAIAEDGTIYVGCYDGLYALGPDGNRRWFRSMPRVTSPVVGSDGTIYVCDGEGYYWRSLSALTPQGMLRWSCDHVGLEFAPALDTDGTIYAAARDSLFAFRPDGTIKWIAQLSSEAASGPTVAADGTIYVGYYVSRWDTSAIYAFDPDGTEKWHLAIYSEPRNHLSLGLAVAQDGSVRYSGYGRIGCVNPDGSARWTTTLHYMAAEQPSIDPSGITYPAGDRASALNADGTILWQVETRSVSATPAIGMDGRLWLTGDMSTSRLDGIYNVNADGSVWWGMVVRSGNVTPPTIGPDGTVYVGMGDSCLYALRGPTSLATTGWPKAHHDVRNTGCAATPNGGYRWRMQEWARRDAKEKP